jgi:hypothetical protein
MTIRCSEPRTGVLALAALALGLSGCVTVYQPLVGLQRPIAVDLEVPNLEGTRIVLRCEKGGYLDAGGARKVCANVRTLFANQGALVELEAERGRDEPAMSATPDLVVDLKARLLHQNDGGLWWLVSIATATLVPAPSEYEFAQDITIRDGHGALLLADTLQGRFIRYFGVGMWALTGIIDLIVRPKDDQMGGDAFKRDFSRDFHGQLSQLAFHARLRAAALRQFEPTPGAPPVPVKGAP